MKLLFLLIVSAFLLLLPSVFALTIIYEDNFTGEVKSEWQVIKGSWVHNSTLDTYSTNETNYKNRLNLDYPIPNDNYVEFKIIQVANLTNEYFDLLIRTTWVGDYESGYAISYIEPYSRIYGISLFLIVWESGVRKQYPDYILWNELEGFSSVKDFEGHTIGISAEGNTIKGYLDGIEILSATLTNYTNGTISIISNPKDRTFIFDDFKVFSFVSPEPPTQSLPISTKIMLGIIPLVMLGGVILIIFKQLSSLDKFDMETLIKTIVGIAFVIIVSMALLSMIIL